MILTIGLIVKNEEKYLEKCLIALLPVLKNVDSELIITDTGSSDKTVEIARKYTNNILHFDWTNDFSAARNVGLKAAHGEWFMQIDADEIFVSCNDIIRFFNTEEYKSYNSASYRIRNIVLDRSGTTETYLPRLTKLTNKTKYVGVIHEVLNTYGAPVKKLNDIANHYGYYYEDEKERRAKYERNLQLLQQRIKDENGKNPYTFVQLAESALTCDEGLSYIEKGIQIAIKRKDPVLIALLHHKAAVLLSNKDYNESLEVCDQYFNLDKTYKEGELSTDADMLAIQSTILYCKKDYHSAVDAYKQFFDVYSRVQSGKLDTWDSAIVVFRSATLDNYVPHIIQYLICACESERYEDAFELISKFSLEDQVISDNVIYDLVKKEFTVLEHFGFNNVCTYIRSLNTRGICILFSLLRQAYYYSDKQDEIVEAIKKLEQVEFAGKVVDIYCRLNKNEVISLDLLKKALENSDKHCLLPDILMIAMDKEYDISELLEEISDSINEYSDEGFKCYYGFNESVDNYNINNICRKKALALYLDFLEHSMYNTVCYKCPKPNVWKKISTNRLLEKYGEIGLRLFKEVYNNNINIMPDKAYAAVCIGKAINYRAQKNYKECISKLKQSVTKYEAIAKYVSTYSDEVVNEYNSASEFEKLAGIIKNNIRSYIAAGDKKMAYKTLMEYSELSSDDPDIVTLMAELK